MIKKTALYFYSLRHQFIKYFIVGFSGFFIDIGVLMVCKEIFHIRPIFSVIISQFFALAYNFSLNRFWSFKSSHMPHKQLVRYSILMTFNYIVSFVAMYIFNEQLSVDYRLVRIATVVCMASWNFFLYKYWVYRHDTRSMDDDTVL